MYRSFILLSILLQSGCHKMFSKLYDDTLMHIIRYTSIRERGRMAVLNKHVHTLLKEWSDIMYIMAYKDGTVFASDYFSYQLPKMHVKDNMNTLDCALRKCVYIRELVISNVDMLKNISSAVLKKLKLLNVLTLPSDLFDRQLQMNDEIKSILSLDNLISLFVLQRYDTELKSSNIFHVHHAQFLRSQMITSIKFQGICITSDALDAIAFKYANTLVNLCFMGAVVHTPDAASYFKALGRLKTLRTLTLPASLYSLSIEPSPHHFDIIKHLPIQSLTLYVYQPEIVECRFLLRSLLPESLEELCLHDSSGIIAQELKTKQFKNLHYKVKFCSKGYTLFDCFWMAAHSDLLDHMLWTPPYKQCTTDFPSQVPGWHCYLSEIVNTAKEDSEQSETQPQVASPASDHHTIQQNFSARDTADLMVSTLANFFERMMDVDQGINFMTSFRDMNGNQNERPTNERSESNEATAPMTTPNVISLPSNSESNNNEPLPQQQEQQQSDEDSPSDTGESVSSDGSETHSNTTTRSTLRNASSTSANTNRIRPSTATRSSVVNDQTHSHDGTPNVNNHSAPNRNISGSNRNVNNNNTSSFHRHSI